MNLATLLQRWRRGYALCALVMFNTLLFLVLVNLGILAAFWIRDLARPDPEITPHHAPRPGALFYTDGAPVDNGRRSQYELRWYDFTALENEDAHYTAEVLDDFYALERSGFIYQPWVQFAEPPFQSRRVNIDVDPRGFPVRRTINPSNDDALPEVQIFVLGGSTTFGYFVSDEQTWPSRLSRILNETAHNEGLRVHVRVTNYGHAYYHPGQEAVLIGDLLKNGYRPGLVIFMDGVNVNAYDVPFFTETLERDFRQLQFDAPLMSLQWLPMVRLADALKRRLLRLHASSTQGEDPLLAVNFFDQNEQMAEAVCRLYSTDAVFFLQPNAKYNYPARLYRRPLPEEYLAEAAITRQYYDRLRHGYRIDLADLFERWGHDRKAIIDDVHYSPEFNEFLARRVAEHISLGSLKTTPLIQSSASTGLPRGHPRHP